MHFGSLSAWISIDGVVLPEYGVGVQLANNVVTCFVPSQAGKAFTVHWHIDACLVPMAGFLKVDGQHCDARVLPAFDPSDSRSQYSCTISHTATPTSPKSSNNLFFASVHYTDDEKYSNDSKAKDIGIISLDVMSVEILGQCSTTGIDFRPVSKLHDQARDLNIAHQVKLGPQNAFSLNIPSIVVDPRLHFVTFVFKYRPIEILRAMGVVPQTRMTTFEEDTRTVEHWKNPNTQNYPIGVKRDLINEADIEWRTSRYKAQVNRQKSSRKTPRKTEKDN